MHFTGPLKQAASNRVIEQGCFDGRLFKLAQTKHNKVTFSAYSRVRCFMSEESS